MSIAIEYWNLVVRVEAIEKHYAGGWVRFCEDREISLPDPDLTDGQLLRVGGMSQMALLMAEEDMKDFGLKGWTASFGKEYWKDYCILTDLASVKDQCKWLIAGDEPGTVQLASPKSPALNKQFADDLWAAILAHLNAWDANWPENIVALNQLSQLKKRKNGSPFSDDQIFEGMLKAVLSNATDWKKVMDNMAHLPPMFEAYSLAAYANKDEDHISNTLMPWFKDRKAASMTLENDLIRLTKTARKLQEYSDIHGTADSYFDAALAAANQDHIRAVALLGTMGTDFKLDGMGMPLAAEAMKNIGYDVAKPDRHVCRALGCFGLVRYRNWADQGATKAPITSSEELIETMRAVEVWARLIGQPPSYVDQVIWLLCAKMGPYLTNAELKSFRR